MTTELITQAEFERRVYGDLLDAGKIPIRDQDGKICGWKEPNETQELLIEIRALRAELRHVERERCAQAVKAWSKRHNVSGSAIDELLAEISGV